MQNFQESNESERIQSESEQGAVGPVCSIWPSNQKHNHATAQNRNKQSISQAQMQSSSDEEGSCEYNNLWKIYRSAEALLRDEERKDRQKSRRIKKSYVQVIQKKLDKAREADLLNQEKSMMLKRRGKRRKLKTKRQTWK